MVLRTAKSCGPGTRCWCQVGGGKSARPGADKAISADDGGKRNSRTGESMKETVKTIACGNAGCSGGPVVNTRVPHYQCTRGCGCSGPPAFPTPSERAEEKCTARAHHAARMRSRF